MTWLPPTLAARAFLASLLLGVGLVASAGCGPTRDTASQLEEARALQDGSEFEASLAILDRILETEPDEPEANYRRGLALIRTGRLAEAIWPLRKVALAGPFGSEAGLLLAAALLQSSNHEEAIAAADRLLEANPEDLAALDLRTRAFMQLGRTEDALADAERALALDPTSVDALGLKAVALGKLERNQESAETFARLEELASDKGHAFASWACLTRITVPGYKLTGEPLAAHISKCVERHPFDAKAAAAAVEQLDKNGLAKEATQVLRDLAAKQPDHLAIHQALVRRLLSRGEREEAGELLGKLAARASAPDQWLEVSELRRLARDPEGALAALREALSLNPRLEEARYGAADLLVDLRRLEEAERAAGELSVEAARLLVLGRVALARGDAERALVLLERGINQWPSSERARLLAAEAALRAGRTDAAISQLREAARLSQGRGESAVVLARLHTARGEYAEALELLGLHVSPRSRTLFESKEGLVEDKSEAADLSPKVQLLAARAYSGLGRYDEARQVLLRLGEDEKQRPLAAAELSRIESSVKGPAAGAEFLAKQPLDWAAPEAEAALHQLLALEAEAGRPERFRSFAERLVEKHPEALPPSLALATACLDQRDAACARGALERAAAIAEEDPDVLTLQGALARLEGDAVASVSLLERAVDLDRTNMHVVWELAQSLTAAGRANEAEARLREVVFWQPDHAGALNNLAWTLAEQGRNLDFAADLARRASTQRRSPEVLDTLGFVHLKRGELDAAVQVLGGVVTEHPDYGTARYHLALALAGRGERERARDELRAALSGALFPESELAKLELARLGEAQ